MKTVNFYADTAGNIGYAVHARHFAKELDKLVPVCLVPKAGRLPADMARHDYLLKMVDRLHDIDLNAVSICLDYPKWDLAAFTGGKKIAYTVFESDLLSPIGVRILNQMDQVWSPTKWGKDVMVKNGVNGSLVRIVPEGVDVGTFKPGLEPFAPLAQKGGFRFLAVGKWEERKGARELLRAFDNAFGPDDDVYLVVYFISEVGALKNINVNDEVNKLQLKNRGKVLVIDSPLATDADMARLYNSCHAFVSAAKAEGWGLPITEAMACGLPVIAPFYSGPTEFLTEENSFPLKVSGVEEIYCPMFFPNKGTHGKWAKIETEALAAKLREVFENKEKAGAVGAAAARDMQTRWQWSHAAKTAAGLLKELGSSKK